MKATRNAHLGLAAASLVLAVLGTPAAAQEGVLIKDFLGSIGVIDKEKDAIDYRERAPLVLPPRMDLREPAAPGSVQARNPQWPNDPDVAARKRQAAEDRAPVTDTEARRMTRENTRLTVDEMRAGRRAGAEIPAAPDDGRRRSLTEPPSAYRQSATGQPIRGSFDVPDRTDESDPKAFLRQQQ